MNIPIHKKRGLAAVVLLILVVAAIVLARGWFTDTPGAEAANREPSSSTGAPSKALPPASNLRIHVASGQGEPRQLLNPDARVWEKAKPTSILLNRTPRIYQTEPATTRSIPRFKVRAIRAGGKIYLQMEWDDATKNAQQAPAARIPESKHLPKRPTGHTSTFPDAAAVMIPKSWNGPAFPSLLMGDKKNPARIFYWNASRGAEELTASGRATPQSTGKTLPHHARHDGARWILTIIIPGCADGYPVAFAIWDGQHGDRDGLKFFSVWYIFTKG
jgi:DMSO reductase family type II enzyme heme b subunit